MSYYRASADCILDSSWTWKQTPVHTTTVIHYMYNDANRSCISWFVYCLQPQRGRSTPKWEVTVVCKILNHMNYYQLQLNALLFPVPFIWDSLWVYQWTNGCRVPLQGHHSRGQLVIKHAKQMFNLYNST